MSPELGYGVRELAATTGTYARIRQVVQAQLYTALLFSLWAQIGLGSLSLR